MKKGNETYHRNETYDWWRWMLETITYTGRWIRYMGCRGWIPRHWLKFQKDTYAVFRPTELAPHIHNGSTNRHLSGSVGILHNMRMQRISEKPRLLIQELCIMRGPTWCQAQSFWTNALLSEAAFIACDENIRKVGLVGKVSTHATKV